MAHTQTFLAAGARSRKSRRRGMALITTVILLFLMSITAASLLNLVGTSITSAQKRTDMTEAFNMADSGLDLAKTWLTQQGTPPVYTGLNFASNNAFYGTNGTMTNPFGIASQAGATLTITINVDNTNSGSVQKHYLIESQATMPSGAIQVVREYVQQSSFGKYAYFAVNDGGGFWDFNNHFEGPVHFNDGHNGDTGQSMFLWQNPTPTPIFTYTGSDAFSVSDDVKWWKDTIGNVSAPTSASDFKSIAVGGLATMTYGYQTDASGNPILDSGGNKIPKSPPIPLPTTSYQQQYAALGDPAPVSTGTPDSNAPTTNGISINTDGGFNQSNGRVTGGLFIHGDNAMTLQLDASGNQQILVVQGGVTQTVTINMASNSTTIDLPTVTSGGAVTHHVQNLIGVPNGMVYSDGNITALSGKLADNVTDASGNILNPSHMTIATDIANSKDVTLTGSITYNTARDLNKVQATDTNFNQKAGIFGILSHHVQVASNAPSNLEFDGSIFATSTFDYPGYGSGGTKGNMTCVGGVITHDSGLFATANGSGAITNGYNEVYHYDSRLADTPPPYFPTTGSHYDIISWQRVITTL